MSSVECQVSSAKLSSVKCQVSSVKCQASSAQLSSVKCSTVECRVCEWCHMCEWCRVCEWCLLMTACSRSHPHPHPHPAACSMHMQRAPQVATPSFAILGKWDVTGGARQLPTRPPPSKSGNGPVVGAVAQRARFTDLPNMAAPPAKSGHGGGTSSRDGGAPAILGRSAPSPLHVAGVSASADLPNMAGGPESNPFADSTDPFTSLRPLPSSATDRPSSATDRPSSARDRPSSARDRPGSARDRPGSARHVHPPHARGPMASGRSNAM